MNLKETYNKIARDWHDEVKVSHWWENGLARFMSLVKKNVTIFDVGCGPGITAKTFIENGFNVVGIDFSEKMIEIAKEKVPEGKFLVMDVEIIDKIPDLFDAIYLQNVLLHIPKKSVEITLKKISEKLQKGGYMYISVGEKKLDGPDEEVRVDHDYGYQVERFFSYFTQEEIKAYCANADLDIVFFEVVPMRNKRWIQAIVQK
jgi:2-polyprenyl-3-methyl-5-hydroxy-6-metoxy-1,4-benzoquinol methylase